MYSCVMGMSAAEGEGCILADEMGLGKTLSAIALIYTMLSTSNQTLIHHQKLIMAGQSPFKKDTAWYASVSGPMLILQCSQSFDRLSCDFGQELAEGVQEMVRTLGLLATFADNQGGQPDWCNGRRRS